MKSKELNKVKGIFHFTEVTDVDDRHDVNTKFIIHSKKVSNYPQIYCESDDNNNKKRKFVFDVNKIQAEKIVKGTEQVNEDRKLKKLINSEVKSGGRELFCKIQVRRNEKVYDPGGKKISRNAANINESMKFNLAAMSEKMTLRHILQLGPCRIRKRDKVEILHLGLYRIKRIIRSIIQKPEECLVK